MKNFQTKNKLFFLIPVLTVLCINMLFSQQFSEAGINMQFDSALVLYSSGKYEEALASFSKIIADYKYNSKTTAAEFFKIKIRFDLKQFNQFNYAAQQFLEMYPNSIYVEEIRMLLTKYNIEVANYYNAFKETLIIIENTKSPEYEIKAKKVGEGIAAKYLNDIQLERINSLFTSSKVKSFVLLQIGKYHIRNGNAEKAKITFNELMINYPQSEEYVDAKKLIDYSIDTEPSSILIGVMLPLETNTFGKYNSEPASEILEGIKYAVDEYNKHRDDKVGLIIRDTKKDINEIRKIKEEFISLNSLIAVLGPIFSNEVRITLEEFDEYDIPIISPTATDDDLTSLNYYFFQANPTFSTRGRVMAQYIFYVENKRIVSVMNSIDGYSPILAASFINEFEKLGGKVIKKVSFKNDYTNFSDPISKIYADSSLIEGIYVPLSDNNVTPYIFSELVKYSTKIPLYGNQDWFTAKGYETAPEISNNLVFESDYFVDFNAESYKSFNERFNSVTGKDANRNVLYGYDAAKYVLTVIRNSEHSRKSLVDKMVSGIVTIGMRSNISFDKGRVNKFLNIVRYRDGVFELVDKFKLSN